MKRPPWQKFPENTPKEGEECRVKIANPSLSAFDAEHIIVRATWENNAFITRDNETPHSSVHEFQLCAFYNTLTNEFGDRIMLDGMSITARHKGTAKTEWFESEKSAKVWLNKLSGKAKQWTKSSE